MEGQRHICAATDSGGFWGCVPERGGEAVAARWADPGDAAEFPQDFHFHDLRHTGNHLMAQSGASTRELMDRMGHSTMRAALIYQHATDERARELASKLDDLVLRHRADGGPTAPM